MNINFKYGDGIWNSLIFRIDPQKAFDNINIKNKDIIKNEYMYMYSDFKYDYFKSFDTRNYIKFKHGIKIKHE